MFRRNFLVACAGAGFAARPAHAQPAAWPARPIRLTVAYPAGSSPDVVARQLFNKLSLGQPVVVENRAGAGGNIGTAAVAKAAADGHTFLFTTQAPLVTAPVLVKSLPYDPLKELKPVVQVATAPLLLVADARLKASTLEAVLKVSKERPGALNYGSTGNGQATHLSMELLKQRTGLTAVHIPFQSSPDVVTAMLGERIDLSFMVPSIALPHIESGKLVPIGMTSAARLGSLPHIPTIAEQGYPGFEVVAWHAVMAPAGTDAAVLARLSSELVRIVRSSEMQAALRAQHFAPSGAGPDELAAIMRRESELWARIAKEAGVRPE